MREGQAGWCVLAHGHAGLSQSLRSCPLVMIQHLYPSPLHVPEALPLLFFPVYPRGWEGWVGSLQNQGFGSVGGGWVPAGGTAHMDVAEARPALPSPYSIHPYSVQRKHLAHAEGMAGKVSSDVGGD